MFLEKAGVRATKAGSSFALGAALALAGCGAPEGLESGSSGETAIAQSHEALNGGWTNLALRNGWRAAANSNVPSVGVVNGIVTLRGALDGSRATDPTAFCLNDPTYTAFHISDVGYFGVSAALANGAIGSLEFSPKNINPSGPDYCVAVAENGASSQPGPNAKLLTSLEGVTFDKTLQDSTKLTTSGGWGPSYPLRGSDGSASGNPAGEGIYAKVVSGFVRFQGVPGGSIPQDNPLLTLPAGMGMIPGHPVYVPVTVCPLSVTTSLSGQLIIQTNGEVDFEGPFSVAPACGISLDGASYSMSSPSGAQAISLSNGWVPSSARAVRARNDGGAIRLEGMVKNGTSNTLGTLPSGMRPAKTIYVIATSALYATPSVLSIAASGVITIVSPALVVAQSGISFDSVSFGL
jgi:hypothetical protein